MTIRQIHLKKSFIYEYKTFHTYPLCKTTHHLITSTKSPKIDQKSLRSIRYRPKNSFNLKPFQPHFYVKFTNEISKNGDTVTYRLKVKKLGGGNTSHENGSAPPVNVIEREYDDFEFLHHTLTTQVRYLIYKNHCFSIGHL